MNNKSLKVYDLLIWLQNELNDDEFKIELLNKKDDLVKTFGSNRRFIQFTGIDYKDKRNGAGVVKFTIYVVGKTIFNDNDSIVKDLDTIRSRIIDLPFYADNQNNIPAYLNGRVEVIEDKFNNTETIEFIYSLVVGIPVII